MALLSLNPASWLGQPHRGNRSHRFLCLGTFLGTRVIFVAPAKSARRVSSFGRAGRIAGSFRRTNPGPLVGRVACGVWRGVGAVREEGEGNVRQVPWLGHQGAEVRRDRESGDARGSRAR
jgi:hypothetical protein